MKKNKNNRKNCGRKPLDWIDKKTQIQITIPNKMLFKVTEQQGEDSKRAMSKLIQSNLSKIIELL